MSGQQLIALLKQNGFEQVRQRGSHVMMQLTHESGTITVPVPDHKEIRIGTLMSIVRQSGLNKSVFEV